MENTNKTTTILLAILILLITVVSILAGVTKGFQDWNFGRSTQDTIEHNYSYNLENSEHLEISATAAEIKGNSVSKTLIATVKPSTASNKKVDWSVAWGEEGRTETVTDYVTVSTTSDGSTTATVTCHKGFTGNIIVTATTRESGFTASCIVTYIGKPTGITLTGEIAETGNGYTMGLGRTYTFDVQLTNPIGTVGSEFNEILCGISAFGAIKVGTCEHYLKTDTWTWYEDKTKTVNLYEIADSFVTANYADGKLYVTTKKTIESYYASKKKLDAGRTEAFTDLYREKIGDCYFTVWIREVKSGVMKEVKINFDESAVTGVDIGTPEISF